MRFDRVFFRSARYQIAGVSYKSGTADQSEKWQVKTTLARRRWSKNSVPDFIQFSGSRRKGTLLRLKSSAIDSLELLFLRALPMSYVF